MILYHVTLFNKPTQEILIPRIPGDTSIGEEVKTNRICLAPSIIQCLRAKHILFVLTSSPIEVSSGIRGISISCVGLLNNVT